jgi:hypothetical protein
LPCIAPIVDTKVDIGKIKLVVLVLFSAVLIVVELIYGVLVVLVLFSAVLIVVELTYSVLVGTAQVVTLCSTPKTVKVDGVTESGAEIETVEEVEEVGVEIGAGVEESIEVEIGSGMLSLILLYVELG